MITLAVFLAFAIIVASIAVYLDGHFSGWTALAARYATSSRPQEPHRVSAQLVGSTRKKYRGTIELGASERGFYLAHIPRFWPGHPPLFIPWEALTGRWSEPADAAGQWDCFEVPTASRVITILLPADVVPPTPPEKQARSKPESSEVTARTERFHRRKTSLRARSRPR
jgi:hypothetical protein